MIAVVNETDCPSDRTPEPWTTQRSPSRDSSPLGEPAAVVEDPHAELLPLGVPADALGAAQGDAALDLDVELPEQEVAVVGPLAGGVTTPSSLSLTHSPSIHSSSQELLVRGDLARTARRGSGRAASGRPGGRRSRCTGSCAAGLSGPVERDAVPSSMARSVPRNRRESVSTASVSPSFSLKIPVNRSTMASRPRVTSPSSSSISASGREQVPDRLGVLRVVGLDERGEQVGDGPDVGFPLLRRRGLDGSGGYRGRLPSRPVLGHDQAQRRGERQDCQGCRVDSHGRWLLRGSSKHVGVGTGARGKAGGRPGGPVRARRAIGIGCSGGLSAATSPLSHAAVPRRPVPGGEGLTRFRNGPSGGDVATPGLLRYDPSQARPGTISGIAPPSRPNNS